MGAQVFLRLLFNAPQAWAEEVGRYLFIWAVFLGAAAALVENRHIRVTVFFDRLGPKAKVALGMVHRLIDFSSFLFIAFFGYKLAYSYRTSEFYTLHFLPRVIFYLSVPICLTIMEIYIFLDIKSQLKK